LTGQPFVRGCRASAKLTEYAKLLASQAFAETTEFLTTLLFDTPLGRCGYRRSTQAAALKVSRLSGAELIEAPIDVRPLLLSESRRHLLCLVEQVLKLSTDASRPLAKPAHKILRPLAEPAHKILRPLAELPAKLLAAQHGELIKTARLLTDLARELPETLYGGVEKLLKVPALPGLTEKLIPGLNALVGETLGLSDQSPDVRRAADEPHTTSEILLLCRPHLLIQLVLLLAEKHIAQEAA
jgi:hypothetical protein